MVMVDEARPLVANIPVPFLSVGRSDEAGCEGKCEKSVHRITSEEKCAGPARTGAVSSAKEGLRWESARKIDATSPKMAEFR